MRRKTAKHSHDTDRDEVSDKLTIRHACRAQNQEAEADHLMKVGVTLAVIGVLAVAGSIALLSKL